MTSEKPSIALPLIALVCLLLCWPLGVILAIVSIIKYGKAEGTEARTLSIVAVAVNLGLGVPIMGILAAIAIPNFIMFQCRSKQSEAKGNLKALYVAEETYRAEKGRYAQNAADIQFAPMATTLRYEYVIVEATDTTFKAEARAKADELRGDLWAIDHMNALTNVQNGCGR